MFADPFTGVRAFSSLGISSGRNYWLLGLCRPQEHTNGAVQSARHSLVTGPSCPVTGSDFGNGNRRIRSMASCDGALRQMSQS
jgi:hypothetical protein